MATHGIKSTISLDIIGLKDPLYKEWKWCNKEFPKHWGYEVSAGPSKATYNIRFYFNTEENKVKFILKWM